MHIYRNLDQYLSFQKQRQQEIVDAEFPESAYISKVLAPSGLSEEKDGETYLINHEAESLEIDRTGIVDDRHNCAYREMNSREKEIFPRRALIRQHRHLVAISQYDCDVISERVGKEIDPALMGVNLVIDREDGKDFSLSAIPFGTYIAIGGEPRKQLITLQHHVTQEGCAVTGGAVAETFGSEDLRQEFVKASRKNRGIILGIEHIEGDTQTLKAGQEVHFLFPMGFTA
ncbi:MAG: hypothetical protein AAF402_08895 [Pseudomonadota bacterium]